MDARIEQYKAAVEQYKEVKYQEEEERQEAEWARWKAEMDSKMTNDVLKLMLEKAEEGIPTHTLHWYVGQLGTLSAELIYCEQEGLVSLYYDEYTIKPFIGLTEVGKEELARLRSL